MSALKALLIIILCSSFVLVTPMPVFAQDAPQEEAAGVAEAPPPPPPAEAVEPPPEEEQAPEEFPPEPIPPEIIPGEVIPDAGMEPQPVPETPVAPDAGVAPQPTVTVEYPVAPWPESAGPDSIILNFKDASLDSVLDYLSGVAGFIVIKDAAVTGRVSIVSRQPVTSAEVVNLLNTVLKDKGYAAVLTGRTLRIVTLAEAKRTTVPVRSGNDPAAVDASDRIVTQVIPLRFVDAGRVRQDLAALLPSYAELTANASSNSLILTDTEANIKRIMEILRALDTHLSAVAEVRVFQLEYASATSTARLINETFQQDQPARGQTANQQFRRFQPPGAPQQSAAQDTYSSPKVTASADERTNTVVVTGPSDLLAIVEQVIKELDSNPTAEEAVFTYRIKNGTAANLATVLNNLFRSQSTSGVGRTTTGRTNGAAARGGTATANARVSATSAQAAGNLAGEVYVVADADTNSLMVMTAQKNFDVVRGIIEELDRPVPQVLIKVLIAEVTHTDKLDLGAEFSILNLRATGRGSQAFSDFNVAAAQDGLIFKLVEQDVTAAIRALQEVAKLNILSRPYILTSDNQEANITIGQEVPLITNSRTTESGQIINTFSYRQLGIILNVTPHINPDGLVVLDVAPEVSSLTGETIPVSQDFSLAIIANRTAQSRVAIQDGQTIVIGGLMEDRKTEAVRKVPVLGSIPLLGRLFRRTVNDTSKTELLIFLTPHVAQNPLLLEGMSQEELDGSKIVTGAIKDGAFQEHLEGLRRGAAKPE